MKKVKLITNANNKRLTFPHLDFSIDAGEIKKVDSRKFAILIQNLWIREVVKKTKKGRKINN